MEARSTMVIHRQADPFVRFPTQAQIFPCHKLRAEHFLTDRFSCTASYMIAHTRLLKAARMLLGWFQEVLADKSGTRRPTSSKRETGQIAVPVPNLRDGHKDVEEGGERKGGG